MSVFNRSFKGMTNSDFDLVNSDPEQNRKRIRRKIDETSDGYVVIEAFRRMINSNDNMRIVRNRLERHELRRIYGPQAVPWDEEVDEDSTSEYERRLLSRSWSIRNHVPLFEDSEVLNNDAMELEEAVDSTRLVNPNRMEKYYLAEFDPIPIIHNITVPTENTFEQKTHSLAIPVLHSTLPQTPVDPEFCGASLSSTVGESPVPRLRSRIPFYQRSSLLKCSCKKLRRYNRSLDMLSYHENLESNPRGSSRLSSRMDQSSDGVESCQSARGSSEASSNCGDSSEERSLDRMLLTISTDPINEGSRSDVRSPFSRCRGGSTKDSPSSPAEIPPLENNSSEEPQRRRRRKRSKRRKLYRGLPVRQREEERPRGAMRGPFFLPKSNEWKRRSATGSPSWRRGENTCTQVALDQERSPTRSRLRNCWNCGGQGHKFRACPSRQTRLFCYSCGLLNKTRRSCSRCLENASRNMRIGPCASGFQSDIGNNMSIVRKRSRLEFCKPCPLVHFQSGAESTSRTLL